MTEKAEKQPPENALLTVRRLFSMDNHSPATKGKFMIFFTESTP